MPKRQLKHRQLILVLSLIVILALGSLALAQVVSPRIAWWTADGGGGASSGGGYALSGTIGQTEAGGVSSDGSYTVTGGFWGAAASNGSGELYLPFFQQQSEFPG